MSKLFTEKTAQDMLAEMKTQNTQLTQLISKITNTNSELAKLTSKIS